MKKIFITGVNGFIGRNLANYLIKKNYKVKGIGTKEFSLNKLDYKELDILKDHDSIKRFTKDCDCFIHLAGITDISEAAENKYFTFDVNTIGTYNILKIFNESNAQKFIFTSAGYLYTNVKYLPIDEKHPISLNHNYSKSKYFAEELINLLSENPKKYLILRLFNIFGPYQNGRVIQSILTQIKKGNTISLGNTNVKRDFLFVEDLSRLFEKILGTEISEKISLYNVGSGKSTSIEQIISLISKISNKKIEVKNDPIKIRKNEPIDMYADISKIKSHFGWEPQVDLKEGLKKMMFD